MKIVHCVHLFPPAQGGIEHHTHHLTQWLANLDNGVVVLTSKLPNTESHEAINKVVVRRFFSIHFPLFSAARFIPGICWYLRKENPDVFCSHGYGSPMPFFTSLVAFLTGKPFVFTLHGYPKQKGLGKIFQLFYKYFAASIFLRIARKVIVVSKNSIKDIEKEVDPSKIVYIPNGIEADEFDCKDFTKNNKIVYVGRLDKDKRADMLIKAFANVKKQFPEIELEIIGPDEGVKADLQKLADELQVSVTFSTVSYDKIKQKYCSSLAVVLPSRYEGFSLVWLEAMASSRPMFSTPVGDAPKLYDQVYGNDKNLFLFRDQKELEEKLIAFIKNKQSYVPIVKKAEYIVKEEYSWANVAAITKGVYDSVAHTLKK